MKKNKITSTALATLICLSLANGNAYAAEEEVVYVPANLQGQAFLIDVNGKIIIDETNDINLRDKEENIQRIIKDENKESNIIKNEDINSALNGNIENNNDVDNITKVIIPSELPKNDSDIDDSLDLSDKIDSLDVPDKTEFKLDEYEDNDLEISNVESINDDDTYTTYNVNDILEVKPNYSFDKEGTPEWLKTNRSYEVPNLDNSVKLSGYEESLTLKDYNNGNDGNTDINILMSEAEEYMSSIIKRDLGRETIRLLVVRIKWQNQYSYEDKVDQLIGYGQAVNKSDLPENVKKDIIDMMCNTFNK